MQGPLSLAVFDCAGKSRGDDRPCMLGLGNDLKRTEEINPPQSKVAGLRDQSMG